MTITQSPMLQEQQVHPADSAAAELLWKALFRARAGQGAHCAADLEEAAFRFYLPMARSVAGVVLGESAEVTDSAQQAAEHGLACAVLAWDHPTAAGFRRFARSAIIRHLSDFEPGLISSRA